MERKEGCCLAPRYGAQAWKMGNIMLKFRPIAPKPAAMAPAPAPAPMTPAGAGRGKRKAAAAIAAGGGGKRRRKPTKQAATVAAVVTAAPTKQKVDIEKEEAGKEKHVSSSPSSSSSGMTSVDSSTPPPPPPPPTLPHAPSPTDKEGFSVPALQPLRPAVASCVTVESVTGTWRDGEAPTCGGGGDEAPAFVSDQWGRVTWMNLAFSRAVSSGGSGDAATAPSGSDAGVVLAAKDGAAAVPAWGTCAGFTCRVRVTCASCPRRGSSLVAPCDVWRLDAGGYLWRLDLQATLTLSLGGLL